MASTFSVHFVDVVAVVITILYYMVVYINYYIRLYVGITRLIIYKMLAGWLALPPVYTSPVVCV